MVAPDDITAMLDEAWPGARVRCIDVTPHAAKAELIARPEHLRPGGYVSGPTQFAAADAAFWFLVSGVLGRPEPMALTSELSIRFLRPALGDRLIAEAKLERAGATSVVATVRVWTGDPDKPCAVAQGTYVLPRSRADDS